MAGPRKEDHIKQVVFTPRNLEEFRGVYKLANYYSESILASSEPLLGDGRVQFQLTVGKNTHHNLGDVRLQLNIS